MKLKLKQEYIDNDLTITFWEKGLNWHYNIKRLKPCNYQKLYDNGHQYLFEFEEEMPLYEVETPKNKPCNCKKKNQ